MTEEEKHGKASNGEGNDVKEEGTKEVVDMEGEAQEGQVEGEGGGLPVGVQPFFVTGATQELFECIVDEHVTAENPYKYIPITKIKEDFLNRAAVSDFSAFKQELQSYNGEEVLLVFDDFEHGENFLICLTEAAKEAYFKSVEVAKIVEEGGNVVAGEQTEEEEVLLLKKKRLPKDWVSLGSEKEIEEYQFKPTRKNICLLVSRKRRLFGAPISFSDYVVAAESEYPPGAEYKSQTPLDDEPPPVHRRLVDTSLQAIPETANSGSQTTWFPKKNVAAQWEPQHITKEQEAAIDNADLNASIDAAYENIKRGLQTNAIINVYNDDLSRLRGSKGISVSSKAESSLKDFQTFKYMDYGNKRKVTSVDFHPSVSGVVVVAYGKNTTFEERIKNVDPTEKSQALVWSLSDPVMPKISLLAPDDILSIAFCPTNPSYVAGGLRNGQVVFWDLGKASEVIKPTFDSSTKTDIVVSNLVPMVKSSIETGHRSGVTFLQWLPAKFDVDESGRVQGDGKGSNCFQFITCAADGLALVWDIRPSEEDANFKNLDLSWGPHLQIFLTMEGSGVVLARSLCLFQTQSNLASNRGGEEMNARLLVVTEAGKLVYISMERPKSDGGKMSVQKPTAVIPVHGGEALEVKRSPFMPELFLTIGGPTMILWHEKCTQPLMSYTYSNASRPISIEWSLQRPCVWFIGRHDGNIDTWDITDSSYHPTLSNTISSPTQITQMMAAELSQPWNQGVLTMLCAGDSSGTVHIVELPSTLVNPSENEEQHLHHFVEREIQRVKNGNETTISSLTMKKHWLEALEETSPAEVNKLIQEFEKTENEFMIEMGLKTEDEGDD
eukprot:m.58031 g.58031  ORF g.58031 m.58031 type:complete len:836 (-) comp7849_c0_seq1:4180-6687(-)